MDFEKMADKIFQAMQEMIEKAIFPVLERLEALEQVEIPAIPTASEVAKTILGGDEMQTLVDLYVNEAVGQLEPIKGEKGDDGKDGRDGIGLAGALIDRDGALVVTLANGEAKALGQVIGRDGKDGTNGKDGSGLTELVRSYDADAHEIVERWGEKELRYPAGGIRPGGYWREGTKSVAAQVWNHAGVAWIAKRDTSAKPTRESPDWEILANKGRDGVDGKVVKAPEPVKLGGSNA